MSAMMVTAHGGSKTITSFEGGGSLMLGGLITKTTKNVQEDVEMKGLDRLISNTTGVPRQEPIMEGVIASTIPAHMKAVPELHKVPAREVGKTNSKMSVGGTYAGPKSGYGKGGKKH
jgi:hypothetical protein